MVGAAASRRKRRKGEEAIVAPGGGTESDVNNLARNLGLAADTVHAILNCEGAGVRSSRRASSSAVAVGTVSGASAWADFMKEQGIETKDDGNSKKEEPAAPSSKPDQSEDTSQRPHGCGHGTAANSSSSNEARTYEHVTPGILVQTGTLDSTVVGRNRTRPSATSLPHDLQQPTLFCKALFRGVKIACVATSSTSAHSIAIDTNGLGYGWGRNERGQLGLPQASCIVTPTRLAVPNLLAAAVGKSHTVLVDQAGVAHAAGSNKTGQCGVNSSAETVLNFKPCFLLRNSTASSTSGTDDIQVVQASCGENFSMILTNRGHIYSAGLSEFGQLGNGETGEYFVAANKIAFANSTKFERRSLFVQSAADASEYGKGGDNKDVANKMVPLMDSADIAIGSISCGKNHTVAVEAANTNMLSRRVFTWGCGDYGCLGHNMQSNEYTPRLVSTLRGSLFAANTPVRAVAGAHCSMVLTKHGHVYYWGKHRTVGEATMRPTLVDALANNMHVVTALGAGAQTVVCATSNAVTVSWGNGPYGELGYGHDAKSSSKPKFVEKLDKCLVTQVSCGYGHTLFLVRDEDEEDKKAWSKLRRVEVEDLQYFADEIANKSSIAAVDEELEGEDGGGGKKIKAARSRKKK